jgi:hypothetical protein
VPSVTQIKTTNRTSINVRKVPRRRAERLRRQARCTMIDFFEVLLDRWEASTPEERMRSVMREAPAPAEANA